MLALQIHENDFNENADHFLISDQVNNCFPGPYIEKERDDGNRNSLIKYSLSEMPWKLSHFLDHQMGTTKDLPWLAAYCLL